MKGKGNKGSVFAAIALIVVGISAMFVYAASNAAANGDRVEILVSKGDLPPGTPAEKLSDTTVKRVAVDADSVPAGALQTIESVRGLKTVVMIFPGQVLINSMFGENNATGGLPIPPGTNAISAELGDPQRVAGFVQPGSTVTVYASDEAGKTKLLLPAATVIAVGPSVARGSEADVETTNGNEKVPSTVVTFALSTADSEKLIAALSSSSLYLGLLPGQK